MAVLDGYGAIVVDGLGTKKEEEDGKMGEREFGSVGRFGRGRGGGGPGTVTQFNPRLLAMKPDEMRNRGKMNEQNDREKRRDNDVDVAGKQLQKLHLQSSSPDFSTCYLSLTVGGAGKWCHRCVNELT